MISSEVQRTLVKSPPELWAELSDPATLARHLGEFGEIRITRIDPEQAVEWEAEDASGKVQIKPSAWGTRVTLTVTRRIPQPDAPSASEPPAQSGEAVEAEPRPTAQAAPTVPDAAPPVQAEPEPAEQTEAGPRMVHQAEEQPDGVAATAMAAESGTEPEVDPTTKPTAESDPDLLPRRGFFSRLFSRRRHRAASELGPSETSASTASPSEPPLAITAVEPKPAESGETSVTWESQFGSPETAAGAQWQPQPEETDAGLELQPPRHIDTHAGKQSQPATAPAADATAEETVDEPPAPVGAVDAVGAVGTVGAVGAVGAVDAVDAIDQRVDGPAAVADAEPRDIHRAEAAEAATAEETEAALTAVLDRLGAAHHRPFSRG